MVKKIDLINHEDVNFDNIRHADSRRLAAQRFKRATNTALRIASKVPGGLKVSVAASLVFPPEPDKVAFKVSLTSHPHPNAEPFEDDETAYQPNKVWFKVNRQGNVPNMEKYVSYNEEDLERFEFEVDLTASRKKKVINMADYEVMKLSLRCDQVVQDNVVGTFIKKLKPLESSRFGVFFKYDPKTHSEVAKIHRLKPGLTAPSIN